MTFIKNSRNIGIVKLSKCDVHSSISRDPGISNKCDVISSSTHVAVGVKARGEDDRFTDTFSSFIITAEHNHEWSYTFY